MEHLKIYDVKAGASTNYLKLLSDDRPYFYWNGKHFNKNNIGDKVFIISRPNKEALFAQIEEKDILTEYNQERDETTFEDSGQKYSAEGKWDDFIRFKIIERSMIPEAWNWSTQLGSSETCLLYTENLDDLPKKKEKIFDLKKLFISGLAKDALIDLEGLLENIIHIRQGKNGKEEVLKNLFLKVLSAYPEATKTQPPKIANIINNELPRLIITKLKDNPIIENWQGEYQRFCYGSVGSGNWAAVPWVAILNPKITRSVSEGVYIVYLFHAGGKGVFLTIAQGTGGIEKAQAGEEIENMRQELLAINKDDYFEKGPLKSDSIIDRGNSRTRAYEKSCILWKSYLKENFNELTDNEIISDLNKIIEIYSNFEKKILLLSHDHSSEFIQIMRRYKDEGTVFQSPSQGARYFISDVNDSGCTVQRIDAKQPVRVTENLFQSKLEMVHNNEGKYRFNDLDSTAATRTTVLQGPPFGLSQDKNEILDLSDDDKACDVFCEIVRNLRVDTVDGRPRLYKPAMVACIVDAIGSGELAENKIDFDWIAPRFLNRMKLLCFEATEHNAAMPFFHLTGDIFWMLCYHDTANIINSGSARPGTIRSRVRHAIIKDTFWRILQKKEYRNKIKLALEERWFSREVNMNFSKYLQEKEFYFTSTQIKRFILSLKAKPFVILTGNSGTGKTKIAQLFSDYISPEKSLTEVVVPDNDETGTYFKVGKATLKYGVTLPVDSLDYFNIPKIGEPTEVLVNFGDDSEKAYFATFGYPNNRDKFANSTIRFRKNLKSHIKDNFLIGDYFKLIKVKEKEYTLEKVSLKEYSTSEKLANYALIPVGANWTDKRHLLGFYNVITQEYQPSPCLNLILGASKGENSQYPFFLILDEMNLSHVERYFSDFLSVMESGGCIYLHNNQDVEDNQGIPQRLYLPPNLFVIGTVNVDETTYMFSPKVLDRANVIEFHTVPARMYLTNNLKIENIIKDPTFPGDTFIRDMNPHEIFEKMSGIMISDARTNQFTEKISYEIETFQKALKQIGFDFGFRVINEIMKYMYLAWEADNKPSSWDGWSDAFDVQILQKMLPKIHGSAKAIQNMLKCLYCYCFSGKTPEQLERLAKGEVVSDLYKKRYQEARYKISAYKLQIMQNNLETQRYVSFT